MITIKIKDNTSKGITVKADGVPLTCVLDVTVSCEHNRPDDTYITYFATVAHTSTNNGKVTAKILRDHGFQVRVLDYEELDTDGKPFEYML
jgi:hypothetical protein